MEGIAKVEAEPELDNRNMIMVLAPDKRARQAAQSREKAQQRTDQPGANASPEAAADPVAGNGASEAPVSPPVGQMEVRRQLARAMGSASRSISRRGMTQCPR